MTTPLQEDLAEAIVKNKSLPRYKRKNKKDLLVSVGYAEITADRNAKPTLEAKGVQDALASYGLTKELVTTSLVEDIKSKKGKRLGEMALGADILGMKQTKETVVSVNVAQIIGMKIVNDTDQGDRV